MESIINVIQEENDLSYWEFINNSDISSDDDNLSIDTLSLDSLPSWHSSLSYSLTTTTTTNNSNNTQNPIQDLTHQVVNDGYVEENPLQELTHHHDVVVNGYVEEHHDVGFLPFYLQHQHHGVVVDEDDDDDDDEGGDDLDDELVPWHLSGKLGRNRMRKLGKRVCAKMTSARRNPQRYVKPGCVHGKHGMGLKGSC